MYTTYWVPEEYADMEQLQALHSMIFPNNKLSITSGMVKVAIKDGENPPFMGTTTPPDRSGVFGV